MSEINCNNCAICDFKESLCKRCDKMKRIGSADDIEKLIIECLPSVRADVPDTNVEDTISRQAAIDLVRDVCDAIMSGCGSHYDEETGYEVFDDILEVNAIFKCNKEVRIALRNMPSAQPESRIEQELHGKTPEEQYAFLYWLLLKFGLAYTDSRLAVIEWLRGEKEDGGHDQQTGGDL